MSINLYTCEKIKSQQRPLKRKVQEKSEVFLQMSEFRQKSISVNSMLEVTINETFKKSADFQHKTSIFTFSSDLQK